MGIGLREYVAPSVEPVSLADIRAHCRVDFEDDDPLLRSLVVAARQYCEQYAGICLAGATYEATLDEFPAGDESIFLPRYPSLADAGNLVSYVDTAGATQTVSAVTWRHDVSPGEVYPNFGTWPETRSQRAAVTVRFKCAADPMRSGLARQAILLIAGEWYRNRENSGEANRELSTGATRILELLICEQF